MNRRLPLPPGWPRGANPLGAQNPRPSRPLYDHSGEKSRPIGDAEAAAKAGYKTLCSYCFAAYRRSLPPGSRCPNCRSEGSMRTILPNGLVVPS